MQEPNPTVSFLWQPASQSKLVLSCETGWTWCLPGQSWLGVLGRGTLPSHGHPREGCRSTAPPAIKFSFQTLSEAGTDQCCVSVPMPALLHNFQLTGEIKIIPDINQLHSALGHNLNTFSWVFFPLYKSSKSTFWPSQSDSRKCLARDAGTVRWSSRCTGFWQCHWGHGGRKGRGNLEKLFNISFPILLGKNVAGIYEQMWTNIWNDF